MSGAKGKSGGPRANAGGPRENSGGKREGAGRKPVVPSGVSDAGGDDAESFLLELIKDKSADVRLRLEAAKTLIAYQKPKMGEQGKKDAKKDAAHAASARFSIPLAPRLTLVKSA